MTATGQADCDQTPLQEARTDTHHEFLASGRLEGVIYRLCQILALRGWQAC